ncbi:hypothetical protein [Novosphingobium sp. BL-52-GroH]|uniref:hypothetical protein n=1 Tax=Novosphingobium sp. BL-52-GroH TaxID=3349877 RepID=UPI00384F3115
MVLPATITSQVDPAAITKVTRLFNNTIGDVLAELVQNARRAGAGRVDIDVVEHSGSSHVRVRNDGAGIADTAVLLALGRSGWSTKLGQREDPAGMGVSSKPLSPTRESMSLFRRATRSDIGTPNSRSDRIEIQCIACESSTCYAVGYSMNGDCCDRL